MQITATLKKIRLITTRRQKYEWIILCVMATCVSMLEVMSAFAIAGFVQVISHGDKVSAWVNSTIGWHLEGDTLILIACFLCAGIYVFKNILAGFEVFLQTKLIQRMCSHFRGKMLKIFSGYSYQKYIKEGAASYLQVFNRDIDQMFVVGVAAVASCITELTIILFLVCSLILMNPNLALSVIGTSALVLLAFFKILLPLFHKIGEEIREVGVEQMDALQTFFNGYKEVVIRGMTQKFVDRYFASDQNRAKAVTRQNTFNVIPRLFLECLFMLTFVLLVWQMVSMHESSDAIIATLGAYFYIGFRMMPGINRLMTFISSIKSSTPSIDRVYDIYHRLCQEDAYVDCPGLTFHNALDFQQCTFTYDNDSHPALHAFDLTIKKGQTIGIMGHTGSGKSTLIDLLLGVLQPTEGRILLDGHFSPNCRQWQRRIGLVPQSVFLLPGSIRDNIVFGHEQENQNDSYLHELLECVQMREFITHKEKGLDTVVGENGVYLSGGERQRIAIARALYGKPDIIVFDEATSALDQATELALMQAIEAMNSTMTMVMVAHRLTTLKNCDMIVKFDNGHLVETGTYEELCQ